MKWPTFNDVALREAGHALAQMRLGVDQEVASIIPDEDGRLGLVRPENTENVCSADDAERMVVAYCAGYAALIAAGRPESVAAAGCGEHFDYAQWLIESWGLVGTLDDWKLRAVALLSSPKNKRATRLIAEHLFAHKVLSTDYLDVLLQHADGECTAEKLLQYLIIMSSPERQPPGFEP